MMRLPMMRMLVLDEQVLPRAVRRERRRRDPEPRERPLEHAVVEAKLARVPPRLTARG
jgi:hypothetical protein